jgi:TonB dependent receptor-like, beta-barrel/Carboxypeptidase regulatory-like domain
MTGRCKAIVATAGTLALLGLPLAARAQQQPGPAATNVQPAGNFAALASGSIHGLVKDETGVPVAGAMVSAVGATPTVAITDRDGHFVLDTLSPGPYFVRVHLSGYIAPRAQIVEVRSSSRTSSTIWLRHSDTSTVLEAGLIHSDPAPPPTFEPTDTPKADSSSNEGDESELSWRLRHIRRGVLKDARLPDVILVEEHPSNGGSSFARMAAGFFADTPFSGQLNLLTTTSFDAPRQLFTPDNLSRGIAYVRLGAPVGSQADWSIRGALNQSDLSSWILAGSYASRAQARHHYEIGMSYSTQRYDGGNPLALRDVTDGSRNAGALYAVDTFTIAPAVTASYGMRYARYDYLDSRGLLSPRVSLTIQPAPHTRLTGSLVRNEQAPGAEEFVPPSDAGIWLPPQRTFSSIRRRGGFEAERATRVSFEIERDLLPGSTLSIGAFRETVDDQLVTLFGVDLPFQPSAELGHYVVGNAGDVSATGCIAEIRTSLANRVSGSVAYSVVNAMLTPRFEGGYLSRLAPAVLRPEGERIHDVSTAIETQVPETATRVLVLYRVSNGFAEEADRVGFDSRFDVQVRQGLPFLNFTSAQWEMLVAVRNFFRDSTTEQTVYDELLVVHPPKRIVGGVTMRF